MGIVATGTLAQPLVVPAIGSNVSISLVGGGTLPAGAFVSVDAGGSSPLKGQVLRTGSGIVFKVTALGSAVFGQTILAGSDVWLSGEPGASAVGPQGPPGQSGAAGAAGPQGPPGIPGSNVTTTGTVTVPNVGSNATVPVTNGGGFPNGAEVLVSNGTSAFSGQVTSGGGTTSLVIACDNIVLGAAGDTLLAGSTVAIYGGGAAVIQIGPVTILTLTPSSVAGWGNSGDSGLQMLETNKRCSNWTITIRGGWSGYALDLYGTNSAECAGKSDGDKTLPITSFVPLPLKPVGATKPLDPNAFLVQPLQSSTAQASLYVAALNLVAVRVVLRIVTGTPGGNVYVDCTATSNS